MKSTVREVLKGAKGLSFDIWLTLFRSNPAFRMARTDIISQALGVTCDGMDELIKVVDDELDEAVRNSGVQIGLRERLVAIATRRKVELFDFDDTTRLVDEQIGIALVEHPPLLMEPFLVETLMQLSAVYEIGVLSNTGFIDGRYMRITLDRYRIYDLLKAAVFSNEETLSKPDQRIFSTMAARMDLGPEEIVHIGDDRVNDYEGARKAGMRSLWLTDRHHEHAILSISDLLK